MLQPKQRTQSTLERARSSLGLGREFFRKAIDNRTLTFAFREPQGPEKLEEPLGHPRGGNVAHRSRQGALPLPRNKPEPARNGKSRPKIHLTSICGQGCSSAVYKCSAAQEDTKLKHKLAIKISKYDPENADVVTTQRKEFDILTKLRHVSLIRVHRFYSCEQRCFTVMERAEG